MNKITKEKIINLIQAYRRACVTGEGDGYEYPILLSTLDKLFFELEKSQHCPRNQDAADEFWQTWNELNCRLPNKGYFENTYLAIDAALATRENYVR